ncbi:hypothetical protein [Hymenobacter fodinae]|uniref:HTH cro/C1-type domain-containing protein n=1 Tax=Hymenobacter fodinae TaxID=2510796 RepID=A0A4Z0P2W9_9BACT|nr:hypothetical protein [Hymenobacter fodinae]TGE05984.1 hypothetical protein EU556_14030 [Hymenobacter fodinae]
MGIEHGGFMTSNTTVGQRFSQLISQLGISKNAFAISLDKTATVIQHLVDERNKPGYDLLCKVFEVYPNVSKDWLLQGAGSMFTTSDATPPDPVGQSAKTEIRAESAPLRTTSVATPPAPSSISSAEVPAPEPVAEPSAATHVAQITAPSPTIPDPVAPAAVTSAPDTSWQTALYTQQMAHQLAMAELRNQHMQEQQRLMQQMMDLMQRQLAR